MSYFERLIVNMLTFISLSVLLPQMVHVQSFLTALLASFVLSILNLLIKPILTLLSLPLTILTMGLFSFLINAVMLQMTSSLVGPDNFGFSSFGASLLVAVIMSVVNLIVTDHNMRKYVK
ncbi:phage holin family protein [Tetragenococcus halophilus]|uniref:Phage holin family protein n=1 Tax=Tetragenococcus halophilus TaxID=51669 RepID=A0A3G5FK74_TETHA|nr:phage holin family protein [Tetragenococcus halophilus]AOF49115.1 membrane protein [Tetragenococcus halophilus]AYW50730.1 phage holin family protein [Tetragenococcus halophilus]AYW50733.1 phage holin family protein [Tetragenococcus halophilus]MCF1602304.1 phage holin family protein [Tetragenococcus halophilus]MCF1675096.1 phage holin family protein [Tetragenococcus halophilus]